MHASPAPRSPHSTLAFSVSLALCWLAPARHSQGSWVRGAARARAHALGTPQPGRWQQRTGMRVFAARGSHAHARAHGTRGATYACSIPGLVMWARAVGSSWREALNPEIRKFAVTLTLTVRKQANTATCSASAEAEQVEQT